MSYEIAEKCGVVGVIDDYEAANLVIAALRQQDNRGRGSTGVAGLDEQNDYVLWREAGSPKETLTEGRIVYLGALGLKAAIAHNRWATYGGKDKHYGPVEARPIYLAHNGNLSDTHKLRGCLDSEGIDHSELNDSEMMTELIAVFVRQGLSLPEAVARAYPMFVGAASVTVLGKDADNEPVLVGFRDPYGVRPLAFGKTAGGYMFASETRGLEAAGAEFIRDVQRGEMITVTMRGYEARQLAEFDPKFDAFEIIYLQDPDSKFYGVPIREIRQAFGRHLAAEFEDLRDSGALVIGVPASSLPAAEEFANELGLEFSEEAITKNGKAGRTFIGASQEEREALRDSKYHFEPELIKGRDLVLVDDSIVRLNTAPYLVKKLLGLGARSVTFLSASPEVKYANFYGLDISDTDELAAANLTLEEMRQAVGCKRLGFLSIDGLCDAIYETTGVTRSELELSCFTGEYHIPIGADYTGAVEELTESVA